MDGEHPADIKIAAAIAEGSLDAADYKGKPLPPMRINNPGWWIQSFMEREKLPDRLKKTKAAADAMLERAVAADTLGEARTILADRNRGILAWNEAVPEDHHLDIVEETDLLTMRQARSTQHENAG